MDPNERIDALIRVLHVTSKLEAERDLDRLLDLVIREASTTLHCERATLFLFDEDRQELYSRWVTSPLEFKEIRLSWNKGIVGLAARERRIVNIPDPYAHPLFNPEFDKRGNFLTRNILAAPLVTWTDNRLLGVLQLLNKQGGPSTEFDERILEAFAAHAAIALERAILARTYRDVEVAREIQASFFPRTLPEVPGYELVATSRPADATGGDYYDVIPLPSGRLGLVVADVCGHGLGPSILMTTVRAMLRGFTIREPAPEVLVGDLSHAIYDDLHSCHSFITLLYGALAPAEHEFHFANAGHGPVALHYQADRNHFRVLPEDDGRGCPLGFLKQRYQECAPVRMGPGDLLVLGTDGLVETRREGQLFGMKRLSDFIAQRRDRPLQEILEELLTATTVFQENGRPDDDLTLVIVRRQ